MDLVYVDLIDVHLVCVDLVNVDLIYPDLAYVDLVCVDLKMHFCIPLYNLMDFDWSPLLCYLAEFWF